MQSSTIEANGIRMRYWHDGDGPLVLLCHGFPELGYSWRHQIRALADAGYRVVAPDMRGYGGTDQPAEIEAYTLCHIASDMTCLVQALGAERAAIVGHDWGAAAAWTSALLRPDVFPVLGLLSVPYLMEFYSGPPPSTFMKALLSMGQMFYQYYFQEPGKAEADLERDVRDSHLRVFYAASATAPPDRRWRMMFSPGENLLDTLPATDTLPPWITEEELAVYTTEFQRTGFRGGLNWYRSMDRDRELLGFLAGSKIQQPSIFMAGEEDAVITMYRAAYDALEQTMPRLASKTLIPGAGHWVQQEKPEEVNRLLKEFLESAWPVKNAPVMTGRA